MELGSYPCPSWLNSFNLTTNTVKRIMIDFHSHFYPKGARGSDHPHQIGDIEMTHERIRTLKLGERVEESILTGNAAKLLKI